MGAGNASSGDREAQRSQLGEFIRTQRRLAQLSQRELAKLTNLSDPYVSQIERGLHAPSVRVLRAIAGALDISAENMMAYAGLIDPDPRPDTQQTTESAIRADAHLTDDQKDALLAVYRSLIADGTPPAPE
ncbi:MAG: helix-turn-helix transcriptional regulator [Acidimicrobiales bacterium]